MSLVNRHENKIIYARIIDWVQIMPQGLILVMNGAFRQVMVPSTAQTLVTKWDHMELFPKGVMLHRMIHLTSTMTRTLGMRFGDATVSLSLLCDARFGNSGNGGKRDMKFCNFHEIPKALDTQLFFGNILMILTLDGSTIVNLDEAQYRNLLNMNLKKSLSTIPSRPSYSYSESPSVKEEEDDASMPMYNGDSPLREVIKSISVEEYYSGSETMSLSE